MKILNLYAGIGGNRKLWGNDHDITAVEWDEQRAAVYADMFPDDTVIVGDAHQYLLDHYRDFDFIWSSPPCPTHGQYRYNVGYKAKGYKPVYPALRLYEQILLLRHYDYKGLFCVENVVPFYDPLIKAQKIDRHLFWANFHITPAPKNDVSIRSQSDIASLQKAVGINLDKYNLPDKRQTLRNCCHPTLGKHILDCALGVQEQPLLIPYQQGTLI